MIVDTFQQQRRRESNTTSKLDDEAQTYVYDLVHKRHWNERDWEQAITSVQYWKQQQPLCQSNMAWHLLDRALQQQGTGKQSYYYKQTISELLSIWNRVGERSLSAKQVLRILQSYPSVANKLYQDIHSLTKIVDAAIKNGEADAYLLAEHVATNSTDTMDQVFASTAMNALAKSGLRDAPQRAEALLEKMKQQRLKPNSITVSAVIEVWANSGQKGAAQRAEQLLLEDPNRDATMFGSVLKAWRDESADRCCDFLQRWQRLADDGIIKAQPTNIHYGTVIDAFAKEGRAQEAEAVIEVMIDAHERTRNPNLAPDRIQFTSLIDANCNDPERAEQILKRMQRSNHADVSPNTVTFNAVLKSWSKSSSPYAVSRAFALLNEMTVTKDTTTYNTVLSCIANARLQDAPQRAEHILRTMRAKPDIITFNTVMDVHAKSNARDAPERVEELLRTMREFCQPDTVSLNTAMLVWSRSRRGNSVERAEALFRRIESPDSFSYNALLDTYARNGATEKAEELLEEVCGKGMASEVSFRTLMKCWAKRRHPDAGFKAEATFSHMMSLFGRDHKNAVKDYTTLVSAWTVSGDPQGPAKAEAYLSTLKDMGLSPDTSFYSAVINAHAVVSNRDPKATMRAFTLLAEMLESTSAPPNLITYNSVLKCLSRSHLPDKAFKAQALVATMEVPPDIRTLDEVMAACAYSKNADTFPIAWKIFQRACNDFQPSTRTFGLFFLAAEGHADELQIAYRRCCLLGFQHDPHVRKILERILPRTC